MDHVVFDVATAMASLALFAVAYAVASLVTRPARPRAAPASPELGDEPPAVVSLLANRWRLTEDASESTLLDLAARRFIELRQPVNDPYHTTVHLPDQWDDAELAALHPYERRVLARVRGLAVDGVVPVTALTFRNAPEAKRWNRRLHHEVVRDARARGLSRRRFSPAVVTVLSAVAAVTSAGLAMAWLRSQLRADEGDPLSAIWVAVLAFALLSGIAGRPMGERDTPAGVELASRWLGVRDWLAAHEEFADLPPASVTVWDRYLAYGAALGVTHTASAVLDLGLGDRRLVWSSHGGHWRRVRVRYPRLWRRYGKSAPRLLLRAAAGLVAGTVILRWHALPADLAAADYLSDDAAGGLAAASRTALVFGCGLLAYGGYVLVRALVDLATTRTITGEVLWVQVWRSRSGGKNQPPVPWLDYLAIDDGTDDRTVAWGLPRELRVSCRERDTVTVRVRPWSRRVVELSVVNRGHRPVDTPVEEPSGHLPVAAIGSALRRLGRDAAAGAAGAAAGAAVLPPEPGLAAEELLTADEVGTALGVAVRQPELVPYTGPAATATFSTVDRGRQVLMVQVIGGVLGRRAWRPPGRATMLTGLADGAFLLGNQAMMRTGEATVVLTLVGDGRSRRDDLPWLLQRVAERCSTSRPAFGEGEPTPA